MACRSKGLFYVNDPKQLYWVEIGAKQVAAVIQPRIENILSSVCYLTLTYRHVTKVLEFSIFYLYSIPTAIYSDNLITSNFTSLSDAWLPANSKFKFSDNVIDALIDDRYGVFMFAEFEQGAKMSEDCNKDCTQKYTLQVRHIDVFQRTTF